MAVTLTMSYKVNSQNVANNTSNVTVYVNVKWTGNSYNRTEKSGWCKIDGTTYNFTSSFNYGATSSGTQTIFTKTVDVTHNSDGTKTLECSASYNTGVSSGTIGASFVETLTTIPRKSTLSVGNGTLGTAQTLTVTRQSTSFTHSIKAVCGSSTLYIKADGSTSTSEVKHSDCSIPFTPPLTWAQQNTTGTSVSVTYTIKTYNGTTSIGSNSYTKTCSIPASVKPSCKVSISDETSYYSTYGAYVKGYSKPTVTITPTLAQKSPIASYKATVNGTTYTKASFSIGVVKTDGTLSVSATVTDKRGRASSAATASVTVLDYSAPKISKLSVLRCDKDHTENDQGENILVSFAYSISSLNSKNTATCKLQYKKSTDSTYTTPSDFNASTGWYLIEEADSGSSYDILLTVTDKITKTTRKTSASTAYTIMHWKANGRGMAIGKISEDDNVFDVDMHIHARNGITVDTDWVDLTLNSAFALYNGQAVHQPKYKVTGNVVTIKGSVSPVTAYTSSTTKVPIASGIPAKYRPSIPQTFVCQGSGMNRWALTVETDGSISEARYGTTTATTVPVDAWLTFTVTYQI